LNPDFAEAHSNLGLLMQSKGKRDHAMACYRHALEIKPDYPEARNNHSLLLLLMGCFREGWPEYEWRWKCKGQEERVFPQPRWTGSSLAGRTLLVHSEQGLGDTLQFIRYAELLRHQGGTVMIEVQPSLLPLLTQSGFQGLVGKGTPLGDFDVHVPLLSLPGIFETSLETIPGGVPYLSADPQGVEHWQHVLRDTAGFRVGVAWQGNPNYKGDRLRSIPLSHFRVLAQDGVELISLQKGFGSEQMAEIAGKFKVRDLGGSVDTEHGAFMDTAAIMKNLDLVVTSDTAVAHLAGALGVPVWVALPFSPDWRWMLDRTDSPWYPTMRLFRQSRSDDWETVFHTMAQALSEVLPRSTPHGES
jgi:hypothetical protein